MNALHYWTVQFFAIFIDHLLQKLTRWNASKTLAPFCWYRRKSVSLKWISHAGCALSPPPNLLLWKMSDKRHWNALQWCAIPFIEGPRLTIWLAWCQSVLSLQYLPASREISFCWTYKTDCVTLPLTDWVQMMQERLSLHICRILFSPSTAILTFDKKKQTKKHIYPSWWNQITLIHWNRDNDCHSE